jgi:type I restriction enzyme M protein
MTFASIVQKLLPASSHAQVNWNYCNVLRDDGMSYGDYPSTGLRAGPSAELRAGSSTELRTGVEQLTYLLLLKMADERTKPLPDLRHL